MNFFGLTLGLAALFIIGLGFVWVIRGEYYLGYLWWPYVMALGGALIVASLFFTADWLSAAMGVFGSNPKGTGGRARHSALSSSRRRPVFASSSVWIGGPCHPFAFAPIA